jgi:hypothetical protein
MMKFVLAFAGICAFAAADDSGASLAAIEQIMSSARGAAQAAAPAHNEEARAALQAIAAAGAPNVAGRNGGSACDNNNCGSAFVQVEASEPGYDRRTQSPMVWLNLHRGGSFAKGPFKRFTHPTKRGGSFVQTGDATPSYSTIDVYLEEGGSSFVQKAVPEYPFAENANYQAQSPDVVHINFEVPSGASFVEAFPHERYGNFLARFDEGLQRYRNSTAFTGVGQQRCKTTQLSQEGKAALEHPAMSLAAKTAALMQKADGPAAAQVPGIASLAQLALKQVKGVLQTAVAVVATDVPPAIAPPAWNNQPFPCLPLVSARNCNGAVAYPITVGDFILADVTDGALDAVVANFPAYYRQHIGATDDATYQRCFAAHMSMQCANAFPMCTSAQGSQAARAPMCFLHCVETLIACPGMWVNDLEQICQNVSVPPACAWAEYTKGAPAQLKTFDEAQGSSLNCP